jgi:anti-sigma factor RsiW
VSRARIARLFAARDAAARRVARLDRLIARANAGYSERAGYTVRLRRESLRREVGA